MNIVLARTFLELLKARNFNKAADRLCVTQSTVTIRIAALEEQLGQQLFVRHRTGVEPTVAGRKFQQYAELMLQAWQHAKQELALSSAQSAMFSVGICADLWESLVGPWVQDIQRARPDLALYIDSSTSGALMERLGQGFLDAALLYEPSPRKGIIIQSLLDESLVLVSTYPRKAERWNPHYVYIRWGEDFVSQHNAIMPTDITPPVTFSDGALALDFIRKRGGSAFFPWRQVAAMVGDGKLHVVENSSVMTRRIFIAHNEAAAQNEWLCETMALLRMHVAERQREDEALADVIRAHALNVRV